MADHPVLIFVDISTRWSGFISLVLTAEKTDVHFATHDLRFTNYVLQSLA
jgi:hypothetical protein